MHVSKSIQLNSGHSIPSVALGTYLLQGSQASQIVYEALKAGYRQFDSATWYNNERQVCSGIEKWLKEDPSKNKRKDVFYTTKLWNNECGYENAKAAIARCLERASDLGYIDLILIHSPLAGHAKRLETWKALQESVDSGAVKSIGVSSFGKHHIDELFAWDGLKYPPAVNQLEISPWLMRQELTDYCRSKGIQIQAYSPLSRGKFDNPVLKAVAKAHAVSVAQVLIRWSLQHGYIPLPKTSTVSRLPTNLDVYSFELSDKEVAEISHPDAYEPYDWECTDAP